jgi:transcriptional regulator with XRE-family HTH domain
MTSTLSKALGQIIRTQREKAQLTQVALAESAGVTESYIQRLEYGQRQPTLAVFLRIAAAFNVSPEEFLREVLQMYAMLSNK